MIFTNGIRMAVYQDGPEDGFPVVLCHGFPELAYSWRHQLQALADAGFRVIAPDQRGYGRTDKPDDAGAYDIHHLTGDLAGLLDAMELERAVFCGHDWGGLIAWFFAIRKIRPLDRLVILNIPHPGAGREAFGWKQRLRSLYALFAARRRAWCQPRRSRATVCSASSMASLRPASSSSAAFASAVACATSTSVPFSARSTKIDTRPMLEISTNP